MNGDECQPATLANLTKRQGNSGSGKAVGEQISGQAAPPVPETQALDHPFPAAVTQGSSIAPSRLSAAIQNLLASDFPEAHLRQDVSAAILAFIDIAKAQNLISSSSACKFIADMERHIREKFVRVDQSIDVAESKEQAQKNRPAGPADHNLTQPSSSAAIDWPTEQYVNSPESKKKYGIIAYLERVWQPLIAAGHVDLSTLRKKDPAAEKAVRNFQRRGRSIPHHLTLPTKKEMTDRALASTWVRVEDMGRLSQARRRRRVKEGDRTSEWSKSKTG